MTYPDILRQMKAQAITLGLSDYAICKKAGIAKGNLYKIWSGKVTPSALNLIKICDALNLEITIKKSK